MGGLTFIRERLTTNCVEKAREFHELEIRLLNFVSVRAVPAMATPRGRIPRSSRISWILTIHQVMVIPRARNFATVLPRRLGRHQNPARERLPVMRKACESTWLRQRPCPSIRFPWFTLGFRINRDAGHHQNLSRRVASGGDQRAQDGMAGAEWRAAGVARSRNFEDA